MAAEIAGLNRRFLEEGLPYLLIGFGPLGKRGPLARAARKLGGRLRGSRAGRDLRPREPDRDDQGSHFFHNSRRSPCRTPACRRAGETIDWEWLRAAAPPRSESTFCPGTFGSRRLFESKVGRAASARVWCSGGRTRTARRDHGRQPSRRAAGAGEGSSPASTGSTRSANTPQSSLDEIFRSVVQILPLGWQYPETCFAARHSPTSRSSLQAVPSRPLAPNPPDRVQGETAGEVEVFYRDERPASARARSSRRSASSIDTVAERLGQLSCSAVGSTSCTAGR